MKKKTNVKRAVLAAANDSDVEYRVHDALSNLFDELGVDGDYFDDYYKVEKLLHDFVVHYNEERANDTRVVNLSWIWNNSEFDGVDFIEDSQRERAYTTLVKSVGEAEKFNYHSDYWGDAENYQEANVDLVREVAPYIGRKIQLDFEDGPAVGTLLGVAIDKQYNDISHTKIVVDKFEEI